MKHIGKLLLTCFSAALLLAACTETKSDSGLKDKLIDSLKTVNQQQAASLDDMNAFVTTLSDGLNAIAVQEDMLFSSKGAEGTTLDKEQLKSHLATFATTLSDQRKRIEQLSDSLKRRGADMKKLQGLIDNLKRQIDEKDKMIAQLRKDIEQKNFSINDLQNKLKTASAGNVELQQKADLAEQELAKHSTGYVIMGTKDALKEGGYLGKRGKVDIENMPKGDFTKVNIYSFTELDIPSKSAKLVTDHSRKSYSIEKVDKQNRKLVIENPDLFWATSKYLIIQIK